jgi:hypothetical protein
MKSNYKIGDKVYIDGMSGFCDPHWDTITDIQIRYDEITGKPYNLIIVGNSHFRSDNGNCVKGPTAYYLTGDVITNKNA